MPSQQGAPQESPDFNQMYQNSVNPLQDAASPPIMEPMPANEGGGNMFGGPLHAAEGASMDDGAGGAGLRRRKGHRGSGGHLLPRTGSGGELELPGGAFIDDIDQFLAYADDEEGMTQRGSSIGPLAETLDKVNLDDDLVSFDLASSAHNGSGVSDGNMMATEQVNRKARRRPKLEQMPPDTFNIQSMDPVMSPFSWSHNPEAPSSITPRDVLGEPKNSFGDLLTPNGTNLNLFSPSGMDFADDYDDL